MSALKNILRKKDWLSHKRYLICRLGVWVTWIVGYIVVVGRCFALNLILLSNPINMLGSFIVVLILRTNSTCQSVTNQSLQGGTCACDILNCINSISAIVVFN